MDTKRHVSSKHFKTRIDFPGKHSLLIALSLSLGFSAHLQAQSASKAQQQSQQQSQQQATKTFTVPANKGYVVPFSTGRKQGVSVPVGYPETVRPVSRWTDKSKSVVWYLYQEPGKYQFSLDGQVKSGVNLPFELLISDADAASSFHKIQRTVELKGTGIRDTFHAGRVEIMKTGYYRYELKPKADPQNAITLHSLLFTAAGGKGEVHQTDYQSSPSVHLSFSTTAPTTKSYDWIYSEILVPKGGDPLATYYEALGFYRGYMGIQTKSEHERRVLFSVWDSKDAEKDKSIQKSDLVTLVAKGPETVTNNFGGEGTGGQSYNPKANWKTGQPVHFLMNVLPDNNGSVVISAWYQLGTAPWVYVASWRAPKEHRYFDGFYAFIENYGYTNGWMRRMAYYYNSWGKQSGGGDWVSFNKVRFSHTDGKPGQRVDYEQGVSAKYPDRFYMASGGYTPTKLTKDEIPVSTKIPISDLTPFERQVQAALKQEAQRKAAPSK